MKLLEITDSTPLTVEMVDKLLSNYHFISLDWSGSDRVDANGKSIFNNHRGQLNTIAVMPPRVGVNIPKRDLRPNGWVKITFRFDDKGVDRMRTIDAGDVATFDERADLKKIDGKWVLTNVST